MKAPDHPNPFTLTVPYEFTWDHLHDHTRLELLMATRLPGVSGSCLLLWRELSQHARAALRPRIEQRINDYTLAVYPYPKRLDHTSPP